MQEAAEHFYFDDKGKNTDAYSEQAVWLCKNRLTGFKTRINGALAQILKKYPNDYKLKFLKMREVLGEQRAATG
jgi:hypothetical protein